MSQCQFNHEIERKRDGGKGVAGQGNGTRSKKQRKVKPAGYEGRRKDEITFVERVR